MSNSYYFYNQMRDLPYSGSTYYKPGLLAPGSVTTLTTTVLMTEITIVKLEQE